MHGQNGLHDVRTDLKSREVLLPITRFTPAKVLPLFYPLGRFERIKTVLMGTNTPHTCIPGLIWQKQARRFSQFELKVGKLRFPIHFVCVSAALYHRGVRGRHFPLLEIKGEYGPLYYGAQQHN